MRPQGKAMSRQERDHFLTQGRVCTLATLDADGWPYTVPLWYEWSDSTFWIIAARHALWVPHLQRDGRVALCVEDLNPTRRVICQGQAKLVEGPTRFRVWNHLLSRLAERYVLSDPQAYVASVGDEMGWLVSVTPRRLVTWSGPGRHPNSTMETAGRRSE